MIEQRCRRVQFVILWALSVCIPMMADGPTTFATYKPIPMRSTSAMPLATNGMEVGWDKPGDWADPIDDGDDGGGSGGYDKPGNWDDPYEGENPDLPIGDGLLPLSLFLGAYAVILMRKRRNIFPQTEEK